MLFTFNFYKYRYCTVLYMFLHAMTNCFTVNVYSALWEKLSKLKTAAEVLYIFHQFLTLSKQVEVQRIVNSLYS
jgi:hypothetical protein